MSHALTLKAETNHRPKNPKASRARKLVAAAADVVAPVWPLKTFIAVNPLQGLEGRPFEHAVLLAGRYRDLDRRADAGVATVNRELIKWCSAFFDDGQATLPMPNRLLGFYRAFADLARYDSRLTSAGPSARLLARLPETPEEAIEECLDRLGVPVESREEFVRQGLAALPGWSGHVKWREQWQDPEAAAKRPATLVDYVAVRLVLTCLLWPRAHVEEVDQTLPAPVWLDELPASEARYRDALLGQLLPGARTIPAAASRRPDAQLVFCIDVRSEPFRRAVENQGEYETLGFAGFFGLPVRVKGYDDETPHDSCPVLLKPAHEVFERPAGCDPGCVRRHDRGRTIARLPSSLYRWLKYNFATPFALAEMLGPWLGLRMLARTSAPAALSRASASAAAFLAPPLPVEPALEGIDVGRLADYGEAALRLMGLTQNLAPLVVFCGHGSRTANNAYASALDCGACGGNHGGPNARILAAILNDPQVRSSLEARGLAIPPDTLFLAGEHDTTTDRVALDPPRDAEPGRRGRIDRLIADLAAARSANARVRCRSFGLEASDPARAVAEVDRRSVDWAEVRPEWGLARNAAFIVGPRDLTRSVDLDGRCFLHSYDWRADEGGKSLTTILTAPMVVAQWINSQYLFSTADNVAFGAGSKSTQNVTGKLGVFQGNASDLMHGLPLQSVHADDRRPYHEPLRLLTVVYAPRRMLDAVVGAQDVLQKLFGNGWVTLACIEPDDGRSYLLERNLTWRAM